VHRADYDQPTEKSTNRDAGSEEPPEAMTPRDH